MLRKSKRILVAILTVALTALCCVCMVACGGKKDSKKPPIAVDATTITYDGKSFSWADSNNATSYQIGIILNGTGTEKKYSAKTSTFPFASGVKQESLEVTVYAKNEYGETASSSKIFTRIDPVDADSFMFDEYGIVSWAGSDDAEEYILEINGKETVTCQLNEYDGLKFGQKNTIRVKPVNNTMAMYSDWSEKVSREYYGTPTNIQYDGEKITWKGYDRATQYRVSVNGEALDLVYNKCEVEYDAAGADVDITVQAIGKEGESVSSEVSEEKSFVSLDVITDFEVKEGILSWEPVEGAGGYLVKNGVNTKIINGTQYTELVEGSNTVNRISVKPIVKDDSKDVYFSSWSETWDITVLDRPNLKWQDGFDFSSGAELNSIIWNSVGGEVEGYNVRFIEPDKSESIKFRTDLQFGNSYAETGEYKISVQAVARENSGAYSSKYCDEVRIVRLKAPTLGQISTVNERSVKEGFSVGWDNVANNNGYQIYLNGSALTSYKLAKGSVNAVIKNIVSDDDMIGGEFGYGIQTLGNASASVFNSARAVTLPSLTSALTEFDITVLPAPTDIDINGYTASWVQSGSEKGFAIAGVERPINDTKYSFENMSSGTDLNFQVCALGDGKQVLPSNFTPAIKVMRLAKVAKTSIKMKAEINDGQLYWDEVNHAESYELWFNNESTSVNSKNGAYDATRKINSSGVTVTVQANANYFNDPDKKDVYYVTSERSDTKQFKKLNAIEFSNPLVVGNTLHWEKPSNFTGTQQLNYIIFDEYGHTENRQTTTNSFQLSGLVGGEDYSYSVKVIGDGDEWINSDESGACVFTKLEKPTVTTNGKDYVWYGVSSAAGYVIKIDGEIVYDEEGSSLGTKYTFSPTFTTLGNHDVEVYAKGVNGKSPTTIDSDPFEIVQEVKRLNTPTNLVVGYSNPDCVVSNGKITASVDPVANATEYRFVIGGAQDVKKDPYCEKTEEANGGVYDIIVSAIGGAFDPEGGREDSGKYYAPVYYIESNTVKDSITLYPKPTEKEIYISETIRWGWDSTFVGGRADFDLVFEFKNGAVVTIEKYETESITLSKVLGYAREQYPEKDWTGVRLLDLEIFKVRAHGNGVDKIASDWVVKEC